MAIISTCYIIFIFTLCFAKFHASSPCERLYFDHGDESRMPYVQLVGIYRKFNESNGHPMFKHEERNYIFEYINTNGENSMAFKYLNLSTSKRSDVGLYVKMKSDFAGKSWQRLMRNGHTVQPYQKFVSYWGYYDWQSESYRYLYRRDAMKLVCVPNDVFRCSSGRVYFNRTFTSLDNAGVLHNHLSDYFEEMVAGYNSYKNNRKIYRHSRITKLILFYQRPFWVVKQEGYSPILRAKDSAFWPEYITSVWEISRGSTWERFTNPTGIRCRGLPIRVINGTSPSCAEWNPCLNGGTCRQNSLTNETVCICGEAYRGPTCSKVSPRCNKYINPSSARQISNYRREESSFASVFCRKSYQPSFFISQCQQGNYLFEWTSPQRCRYVPPQISAAKASVTMQKLLLKQRNRRSTTSYRTKTPDWFRPLVLAIVPLLQILIPTIHMIIGLKKGKSALRIISLHAFITYIWWLLYLFVCGASKCAQYGEGLGDLVIMGFIMVLFSYFFMLIESCYSSEKQYIANLSTDISVVEYVNKLKNTDPVRQMTIECYHMETRTRTVTYTDAQGNTQTRL